MAISETECRLDSHSDLRRMTKSYYLLLVRSSSQSVRRRCLAAVLGPEKRACGVIAALFDSLQIAVDAVADAGSGRLHGVAGEMGIAAVV